MSVRFEVSAADLEEESLTDAPDVGVSSRSSGYGAVSKPQVSIEMKNQKCKCEPSIQIGRISHFCLSYCMVDI